MNKKPFGNTGIFVSPITFGAWSIGGPAVISGKQVGWSGVSEADALDTLRCAYDMGITAFDTADSYANGKSEELIGAALGSCRHDLVLSTKVGLVDAPGEGITLDFSREHIREACHASLRRLRTDYIDIYFLHMVTDGYPLTEEIRESLEGLKKEGKIRHYGVSVQTPAHAAEQVEKRFGDSMMIEYNMLSTQPVSNAMEAAHRLGYGIITRGALGKGLLTGKYKKGDRFPADDVRSRLSDQYIDETLEKVQKLGVYLADHGISLLTFALAYQLANKACSTVTVGLKTRRQVMDIVRAMPSEATLRALDWAQINTLLEKE